ncbi:hypothetical protein DL240_11365 [Lujinxingia litoralis]|uniref:histidine kinase n=1 Tax=Lujinxingia litoralis TaxID=2211119 RepID=A0A328C799_9DELT|nr:PAS domain S-box protein [Lujinxingia litoralis]RAL22438.1 hypothetical protein DL240_11365 [Lujinxingia litoralis]
MSPRPERYWQRRPLSSRGFALMTQPSFFLNVAELLLQFRVRRSEVGDGEEHWLRHRVFEALEELLAVIVGGGAPDVVLVRADDPELATEAVRALRAALKGQPTRIWVYGAREQVLEEAFWRPVYEAGADDVFSWRPELASERLKLRLHALARRLDRRSDVDHAMELVRKTIDVLPHAVFIRDASGRMVFCNDFVSTFVGLSEQELLGTGVSEVVIGPEDFRHQEQGFLAVLQSGVPLAREEEWIRADGESRWFQVTRVRIEGSDGRLYVVGLASDITRVRTLAEQIHERDQVLAQINEHMPAIVFQLERRADRSFEVPYLRVGQLPGFEKLRELSETPERALLRVVSEDLARLEAEDNDRPGDLWRGKFRMIDDEGCVRWMSGHASAKQGPEGLRWYGVLSDITERELMEERLAMADRLASLGTLSSGLAHEINNPLTVVTSNLDVLLRGAGQEVSPELQKEMLASAREGATRIGAVVDRLRGVNWSGGSEAPANDLRAIVDTAVRLVRQERSFKADVRVAAGARLWVDGAAGSLVQALVNVLTNSAEAVEGLSEERQVVEIVLAEEAGGRAVVTVRDRGTGMGEGVRKRAREPFFTTREVGEGSGLGLYSSHAIAEALGGELTLLSQEGVGTTVRIVLPAEGRQEEGGEAVSPERRRSVLVIDDELAIVEVIARLLKQEFDVFLATSAQEALERLDEGERFDAIISDLMMPQMSGMALLEVMQERYPEQALRMGFISGGLYTEEAQGFVEERPERLLIKPFDARQLRALVEGVARQGEGGSEMGGTRRGSAGGA